MSYTKMSFDEYVKDISQKYRLAVAISVIKSKPNNLSIEEYLLQLQSKINMENGLDETVCSDDFNFDDEDIMTNEENQRNIPRNVTEHEFNYGSNELLINESENDSQNSQTILKDFYFGTDAGRNVFVVDGNTNIEDTLKMLKGVTENADNVKQPVTEQVLSQETFCESQESIDKNLTFCYSINHNKIPNTIDKAKPYTNITEHVDSQQTQIYSLHGFTQNYAYTHVSQSQNDNFVIDDKFIRSKVDNVTNELNKFNEIAPVLNDIQYNDATSHENDTATSTKVIERVENSKDTEECINVTNYIELSNDIFETQNDYMIIENDKARDLNETIEEFDEMEIDGTDSDDVHKEIVPFKVLEELNKVKCFLNKRDRRNTDGYSTESGYRSDSQVRSSFKSSQLSSAWLNQSAHCLFSFIVEAPSGSDDIINEISQVLGNLIDKLHDEENYPSFLEELLETVDGLIRDTNEGSSCAENVLTSKNENTHRLVLLNKSRHILKHSIEYITKLLENLHSNLTKENLYELTNITETENSCYLFNILEIFLKKYMKLKDFSSQSTQSQEEDRFPKRSSLTDLWKRKWNPNYKETCKFQENTVCVLKRCREILNKIIVECMNGYSLVAFAALQCFNLIQT